MLILFLFNIKINKVYLFFELREQVLLDLCVIYKKKINENMYMIW